MDGSPPVSSVHRNLQARILEWVAISFCRGSSKPRDRTHVSCIGRKILPLSHHRLEIHSNNIKSLFPQVFPRRKVLNPILKVFLKNDLIYSTVISIVNKFMCQLVLGTSHCFPCETPSSWWCKRWWKDEMTSSLPLKVKNLVWSYFPHYTDLGQYNLRF